MMDNFDILMHETESRGIQTLGLCRIVWAWLGSYCLDDVLGQLINKLLETSTRYMERVGGLALDELN